MAPLFPTRNFLNGAWEYGRSGANHLCPLGPTLPAGRGGLSGRASMRMQKFAGPCKTYNRPAISPDVPEFAGRLANHKPRPEWLALSWPAPVPRLIASPGRYIFAVSQGKAIAGDACGDNAAHGCKTEGSGYSSWTATSGQPGGKASGAGAESEISPIFSHTIRTMWQRG